MKKYQELFPEIANAKTAYELLDFIRVGKNSNISLELAKAEEVPKGKGSFQVAIEKCIEKANYKLGNYEFKLMQLLLDILIRKNVLQDKCHSFAVDILLGAAALHNIYIDENAPYTSAFRAREEFEKIMIEQGVPMEYYEIVFETIEKQFGEDKKMKLLIPQPGTPMEWFSTCVWLVRETDYIK